MRISERHASPDGNLVLEVAVADDGEIAVGFEGGDWHTHSDLLAHWLDIREELAVSHFIELVKSDALPIVMSTDGGKTIDPWISDNLPETIRLFGLEKCVLRFWSGKEVPA